MKYVVGHGIRKVAWKRKLANTEAKHKNHEDVSKNATIFLIVTEIKTYEKIVFCY